MVCLYFESVQPILEGKLRHPRKTLEYVGIRLMLDRFEEVQCSEHLCCFRWTHDIFGVFVHVGIV